MNVYSIPSSITSPVDSPTLSIGRGIQQAETSLRHLWVCVIGFVDIVWATLNLVWTRSFYDVDGNKLLLRLFEESDLLGFIIFLTIMSYVILLVFGVLLVFAVSSPTETLTVSFQAYIGGTCVLIGLLVLAIFLSFPVVTNANGIQRWYVLVLNLTTIVLKGPTTLLAMHFLDSEAYGF